MFSKKTSCQPNLAGLSLAQPAKNKQRDTSFVTWVRRAQVPREETVWEVARVCDLMFFYSYFPYGEAPDVSFLFCVFIPQK